MEDRNLSKAERVGSIKEYRRTEKQAQRKEESFIFNHDSSINQETQIVPFKSKSEIEPDYSRPSVRGFMKKRKEREDE